MYFQGGSIIIPPTTNSSSNYNHTDSYETSRASELSSMETMRNDHHQHNHHHLHQHLNQHSYQRNRYHPMYILHQRSNEASSLQQQQDAIQRRIPYYNYLPSCWSVQSNQGDMSSSRISDSNRVQSTEDDPQQQQQQQQQSANIRDYERSTERSLTTVTTAFDINAPLNRSEVANGILFKKSSSTSNAPDVAVLVISKGNNVCTCKKSRCLMLYCQCFKLSVTCGVKCRCNGCNNTPNHGEQINKARRNILQKNSTAFDDPREQLMASTQIHHETVGVVSPESSTPNTPKNSYASAQYRAALAHSAQQQVLMQSTSPKTASNRASPLLSSEVEETNEKCDPVNTPVLSSNSVDTATGIYLSIGYPTTLKSQADNIPQAVETTQSCVKAARTHPASSRSGVNHSYLGPPPSLQRSSDAAVFSDRRWAMPGASGSNNELLAMKLKANDTVANSDENIRNRFLSGISYSYPGTSHSYSLMNDERHSTDVANPMQPVVPTTLNERNDRLAANQRLHSQSSSNNLSHQPSSSSSSAKQGEVAIPAWEYPSQLNVISRQGCKCQRIMCLKKYCECFSKNLACSSHCKCVDCENTSARYMKKPKNSTSTTSSRSNDVLINQESKHFTNAIIEASVQVPIQRSQYQMVVEHNDEEALSLCNSLESNSLDGNDEQYGTNDIEVPSLSPPPPPPVEVIIQATKNIKNDHSTLDYNSVHVQQREQQEQQRQEHDQLDIMAAIAMTELFKRNDHHHYTVTSNKNDDIALQKTTLNTSIVSVATIDDLNDENVSCTNSTATNTTTGSMSKKRKAIDYDNNNTTTTSIDNHNHHEEDTILATVKK